VRDRSRDQRRRHSAEERSAEPVYANVLNKPVLVPAGIPTSLGSGIFALLAAGRYKTIEEAQAAVCLPLRTVEPDRRPPRFTSSFTGFIAMCTPGSPVRPASANPGRTGLFRRSQSAVRGGIRGACARRRQRDELVEDESYTFDDAGRMVMWATSSIRC
jgi:hypothetical protein